MFHSAAVKLTGWYLAIIMVLSFGTSLALYQVSSNELEENATRQVGYFRGLLGPDTANEYSQLRQVQLNEDRKHLRANLVLFNTLVLVGGGAASYALARRTLKPIEDALEAQIRFTGDASHELRTPLTAMQTENEVALRNPNLTKKKAIEHLRSNLEEVAKLRVLSESLLTLARGDSEENANEPFSLNEAVKLAAARVAKAAEQKKITIETPKFKDITAKGGRQGITDLLVILLDNAIKYSPGGTKVSVDALKRNKQAWIRVTDQGRGIKRSDLPHIFDRFYRSDHSRSKQQAEGYGLGLAIAKKIADQHNASIEVQSAPNKGSTFTVKLPL